MSFQLTSTRVEKGEISFAPSIKARNRKKLPPTIQPVQTEEPKVPSPTKSPVKVAPPVIPKINGNMISVPTRPKLTKPVITERRGYFNEESSEISEFTITELINSKFKRGKMSKFEEMRKQKGKQSPEPIKQPVQQTPRITPQAPQFKLVNGSIQIDHASLQVVQQETDVNLERVEEDALRPVTSASFRAKKRLKRLDWTDKMTERFLDGLSYFGTDFGMISLMFPGMTRKHLKIKFVAEERRNPDRITKALLNPREPDDELKQRMKSNIDDKKKLQLEQYVNPGKLEVKKPPATTDAEKPQDISIQQETAIQVEQQPQVQVEMPTQDVEIEEPSGSNIQKVNQVSLDLKRNSSSIAPKKVARRRIKQTTTQEDPQENPVSD